MKKKQDNAKLELWQERLARNETQYAAEVEKMTRREELYRGSRSMDKVVDGQKQRDSVHVRNICAELIEAQVSSSLPAPKVTARREGDEDKAKLIEDMLRNEMDRLPFEMLNDMMERTVPIQGGAAFLVEWDNTKKTHTTVGELVISTVHPKRIVPQSGVYSDIEDMDYIILKVPQTKELIEKRYGVDISDESEREPEIRGNAAEAADDLVTQYIAYAHNGSGGISLFSWVNDTVLEDMDDYQARRLRRCKVCGALEPAEDTVSLGVQLMQDGNLPGGEETLLREGEKREKRGRKKCPFCGGSSWEETEEEFEELTEDIVRRDGTVIAAVGEDGERTKVPYYKPDIFPVILQKNVSVFGKLLGDSDLDKIEDQQNTLNQMETKIIDKLMGSGSYITLPNRASIRVDPEDGKVIRIENAADKAMIDVYDMQGNISQDMAYMRQVYEEARQTIGITDSFQGRKDTTATSGKAKEFSAAQSAGRLESKRVMKEAAYARLFEAMFKFKLAYTDEPRPVVSDDIHGNRSYQEFNRYDFLERDAAGELYWNDQFLFSCDTSAPLASNREAMWQETRMNLQSGAFGDPTSLETLVLFWTKMQMLHYPGAGDTKGYLEEALERQKETQQSAAQSMPQGMPDEAMLRQVTAEAAMS